MFKNWGSIRRWFAGLGSMGLVAAAIFFFGLTNMLSSPVGLGMLAVAAGLAVYWFYVRKDEPTDDFTGEV